MSGFDAGWLTLREPADHRARSAELARRLGVWLAERAPYRPARIVDLGCGTGSNVRFLAPRIGGTPAWTCIDDDARLLSAARHRLGNQEVHLQRLDLVRDFDALAEMPFDAIVCSALLDLVSLPWLARLVALVEQRRAAALFALSYDGRLEFAPSMPDDPLVRQAFNAHQARDKGFGPALGPRACAAAAQALHDAAYAVHRIETPWDLDARSAENAALLGPLVDGIAAAAIEQSPADRGRLDAWRSLRRAQCASGELRVVVGHDDTLGLPPPHDQ